MDAIESIAIKAQQDEQISVEELQTLLSEYGSEIDLIDLLPITLKLNGQPMDVANKRPFFAPLFRKERKAKREIYLCGRQVAKTTSVAGAIMMNMLWRTHFAEMYVAPLAVYASRIHQVHMNPMIQNCMLPWPVQDKNCISNTNTKTFLTNSIYYGISCFNSPAQGIGVKVDSLRFDETQDLNYDFIPMIRETLRMSDYRWETYTGTARGVENTIQQLFDESSSAEWHMRCSCKAFGNYIVATKDKHAISMIQRHGIACPDCSRLIDVTQGEWVHRYPDRLDPEKVSSAFAGYHIPATIVLAAITPLDRYLETIYDKLHGLNPYSEAKFFQEILGISSDQGGRPLTPDQLKEVSVLKINLGKIQDPKKMPNLSRYQRLAGGVDWGGAEITSFTVGTIVGWHTDGVFHCLGAIRPMGIPDNERHFPLAAFFKNAGQGKITGIGADAGFVGSVQNKNLARASQIKVLSIGYGTNKLLYKMHPDNNAVVDRTTLIWIAYSLLLAKKLLLPEGDEFMSFSKDLLATFIEDVEAPNGVTIRRYCRYKTKADDFLHALGYAVFVCALEQQIDLPKMLGIGPKASLNRSYIDLIGEEDNKPMFANNQFYQ